MSELKDKLTKFKPNVKPSTIKQYLSSIKKVYNLKSNDSLIPININFLLKKNPNSVKKLIEDKYTNSSTQKNLYSAIVVFLQSYGYEGDLTDQYGILRDTAHKNYTDKIIDGGKSNKQAKNWASRQEIKDVLKSLRKRVLSIYSQKKISKSDTNILREYYLLLFHCEIPIRNDLADMKIITNIKDDDKVNNFYFNGKPNKIILNAYKTRDTFGIKKITIPTKIKKDLQRYLKINTTGYLIPNSTLTGAITPNGITKAFINLFQRELGKNISTTMIRHIFLTEKYAEVVTEMKKDANMMGHSVSQQKDYILKTPYNPKSYSIIVDKK